MYNRQYYVFPGSAGLKLCFIPGNCCELAKELEKIYHMAHAHFTEHILRPIRIKQEFIKFILGISVPNTSCSLTVPSSELELENHLVPNIDSLRKENSELKSKV